VKQFTRRRKKFATVAPLRPVTTTSTLRQPERARWPGAPVAGTVPRDRSAARWSCRADQPDRGRSRSLGHGKTKTKPRLGTGWRLPLRAACSSTALPRIASDASTEVDKSARIGELPVPAQMAVFLTQKRPARITVPRSQLVCRGGGSSPPRRASPHPRSGERKDGEDQTIAHTRPPVEIRCRHKRCERQPARRGTFGDDD
jgi:hypothetical protein